MLNNVIFLSFYSSKNFLTHEGYLFYILNKFISGTRDILERETIPYSSIPEPSREIFLQESLSAAEMNYLAYESKTTAQSISNIPIVINMAKLLKFLGCPVMVGMKFGLTLTMTMECSLIVLGRITLTLLMRTPELLLARKSSHS